MIRRQHAEAVTLNLQCTVEPRAIIFQRYRRRQFDNLFGAEQGPYFFEHRFRNVGRCTRHPLGIPQYRSVKVTEMWTRLEVGQILQLLIGDTGVSAYGGVDIYSKGTTHHLGHTHRYHRLEAAFDHRRSSYCLVQFRGSEQNLWPMSHHEIWCNHAPE
jgi:hypothetical protein